MECTNSEGESGQYPGTKYRICDPAVDNIYEVECSPCAPGYFSTYLSEDACSICPEGTASDPADCTTCPAGTSAAAGSATCSECEAGSYGAAEGALSCSLCPAGTANTNTGSVSEDDCLQCIESLSFGEPGSATCAPAPEHCLEVRFVDSCVGTLGGTKLAGVFVLWEGECANTGGRPAYYNSLTENFLFYYSPNPSLGWMIAPGCGMSSGIWAHGGAGGHPFEDTAATWQCGNNGAFVPRSASIECSFYDGQPLPCSRGKYEPAGEAPGGECSSSCPPHLPTSPPGSNSLSSCMAIGSNFLLVSSATDRLMELNIDASDFSLAIEGGDLREPWGVACVSEILCLVGNDQGSNVVAVNLRGEVMGVFAHVGSPLGLLHIKHRNLLAVASRAGNGEVFLFDLADLNLEQPLQESDAVQTIVISASDGVPMYISLGEHDSELLITTSAGKVLRRCLEGTGCTPQTRNSVMMQYGGSYLRGIGVLDETYIVADTSKIYKCPLTSVGISKSNCEIFADQPQGTDWDPTNVLVDPIKRLVFVVDLFYSDVLVLDFDGAFLAPLASSRGALMLPRAMAQRPGLYAPLSPSHPPSSLPAAGERIEVALSMMDAYNFTVSNSHPTSAHDLALEVSASGYITGTNFTTTIAGEILYDKNSPAHASLTASVVIPYAGDWSVSVTQGTYNVQHFLGSPQVVTLAPAGTDPASCVVEIPNGRSITAGSSFEAVVRPFDGFENPTSHSEDSFKSRVELGNSEENFGNRHVLSSDHTFSELQTVAGAYKLFLYHTNTQREVAGSPISFDVLPAAPSAATSTVSAGDMTSILSAFDTTLSLQAFINDAFGNEVLDAPGVVVQVQGLDSLDPAAVVEHVLEGPRFSHTVTVPQDLEATLTISFSLDGVQIGEPVEITVAPTPPDHTIVYIVVVSSILLLVATAAYCLQRVQMKKQRKLERVERQKELKLSMDEKLVKDYTNKMKKQRVYFALEVGDVVSDLSKAIYLAATFTAGREWFLALVVAVGLLALVQAYISIPVRRKMLKHYEGIIEGDMLHIYAEAEYGEKKEGERTVGEDNLKLNEKTAKIEDLPGLFVFMVEMAAFPEGLSWVSAATGVFSGLMLGRKFSGGAKKEELVAKKREIEEEMDKLGGAARLSLRGSMKAVESVFGRAAAREMEGEVEEDLGAGEEGGGGGEGGDIEMAETRPAELPGSVTGGDADEEEKEGEGVQENLQEQLSQALAEADALRSRAVDAEAKAAEEADALRSRAVDAEAKAAEADALRSRAVDAE
ncbi:hypothetical protein TeGR_g9691, partial [Tetraparma gracilis]